MKLSINLKSQSAAADPVRHRYARAKAQLRVSETSDKVAEQKRLLDLRSAKEKWTKARIEAARRKLDAMLIDAKVKANAVFTKQGHNPPYVLSAKDLALIGSVVDEGKQKTTANQMLQPYLTLFSLHGFKKSLLDLDPNAALAFKPASIARLTADVSSHAHLFTGELYKRVGVKPKDLPTFLDVASAAGYPTAAFGFELLDTKLKAALGSNTILPTRSVVSPSYMFLRHRVTGDALLVEFADFLKSHRAGREAAIISSVPQLAALPEASDAASWKAVAGAFVGNAFGDAALVTKSVAAFPKAIKGSDVPIPSTYLDPESTRGKQYGVMMITFILHRLLAGLLFFSKKAKWKGENKLFVDRMVNAYATILVSVAAPLAAKSKGAYPTLSMIQAFFLQSKTADAMLSADGITTEFSALIKPYASVPSVRTLYAVAPAAESRAKPVASFAPEKPVRLTAAKLQDMTTSNLAWMLANEPEKLLKLYGESPQFDLDFSALRAAEMAPLVKYLATSPEYARNVPSSLHRLIMQRWNMPEIKPSDFVHAYAGFSSVGLPEISRIASLSSVSNKAISPLIPKLTKEASQYLVLQLVSNSANATKGAFGKINKMHAEFNGIKTTKVVATDLKADDIEVVRATFKEAQQSISSDLLNAGYGAKDINDFTVRIQEAYKVLKDSGGKLVVSGRKATDADFDLVAAHMTLGHSISAFRIDKAFNVKSKAKEPADSHKVVHSVWHGTDVSAASCIALTGFKVADTNMKVGRSMGSVVYVAPNPDKSMQYLGSRFSRNGNGILFNGIAYVKGAPKLRISGRAAQYDWTKTDRFSTEEIGLVNANIQFDISRAYSVMVCSHLPRIHAGSPVATVRNVARTAASRLVSSTRQSSVDKSLASAKSIKTILEVLRGYGVALILGKPDDADRKANAKFTIDQVG